MNAGGKEVRLVLSTRDDHYEPANSKLGLYGIKMSKQVHT